MRTDGQLDLSVLSIGDKCRAPDNRKTCSVWTVFLFTRASGDAIMQAFYEADIEHRLFGFCEKFSWMIENQKIQLKILKDENIVFFYQFVLFNN